MKLGKPWVYLAAVASYGILMPIVPGETACLRCIFPQPAEPGSVDTCDTAGVSARCRASSRTWPPPRR